MKLIYIKIKSLWREHEIFRNFTAVFSVDVLVKVSSFLLLPVYLRLMTQEEFGLYNYWLSIIGVFFMFFSFGMSIAQSKLFFDYSNDEKGKFLFTLNMVLLVLLVLSLSILYLFKLDFYLVSFLFKNIIQYEDYRNAIFLGIVATIYSNLLLNYFVTTQNIKLIQLYNIVRLISINLFVIIILNFSSGDNTKFRLQYNFLFETFVILIFSFFYIKIMNFSFILNNALKILKIGIPYTLAAIPGIAIIFIDKYYIEKYTDFKSMSVYYLAFTISSVIPIMLSSLQNIWMPVFFKENDLKENIRKTKKLIIPLTIVFVVVSIGLIIGIKLLLVTKIISPNYQLTIPLLPIMLLSQIFVAIATIIQNYLIHFKRTELILAINVIFLLPSIYLTKTLTFHYEIFGAATAFLIINIIGLAVYYILVKKISKLTLKSI